MKKFISFAIKHKKLVIILFFIASLISIFSQSFVKINYDLQDYLPQDTPSTQGVDIMAQQFEETIFNMSIMIPDASINEALMMKEKVYEVEEVVSVLWLDDYVDVTLPIQVSDQQLVNQYYKDNNALFMVTVQTDNYPPILDELQSIVKDGHVAGQMVSLAMAQSSTQSEIGQIMIFVVPLVLIVLILATHSWLEPVIMLFSIGIGILINMGTNLLLGEVSFLTQAVAAILQLAVSMDYAIFLLHRFNDYREKYDSIEEAMKHATINSLPTLLASSITTFIGFLALTLMRFRIGPDMGLVLAKGVFVSLLSVLIFLPCITILFVKWIDKTTHRSFLPSFDRFSKLVLKITPIVMIMIGLIMVPAFLAQRKNHFMYGMGDYQAFSREELDDQAVKDVYGEETQMVILVPKGQWASEIDLIEEFESYPEVKSILSYISMVGPNIPYQVLPENEMASLLSQDYSRIILQVVSAQEGEHAFGLVERVRETIQNHYPDQDTHLVGSSVITYDMAKTIQSDDIVVNGLAVLAIFITILLTFKSLSVPIILVLAIEVSIWINLSIPYFTQSPLNYIGYLIISTVQLGATVDYGVLYTQNYLENRLELPKKEATLKTIKQSAQSILPPAIILTVTGFILGIISTITIVSELGWTLGRGALLSLTMVLLFVPGMYYYFDNLVDKTTLFYKAKRKEKQHEEKTT